MSGRLTRSDFANLRVAKKKVHGALFSLSVFPLPEGRQAAFACIVAKKEVAKASTRNSIKRRCREAARSRMRGFTGSLAFVFRAKRAAARASFEEIKREVDTLMGRIE